MAVTFCVSTSEITAPKHYISFASAVQTVALAASFTVAYGGVSIATASRKQVKHRVMVNMVKFPAKTRKTSKLLGSNGGKAACFGFSEGDCL